MIKIPLSSFANVVVAFVNDYYYSSISWAQYNVHHNEQIQLVTYQMIVFRFNSDRTLFFPQDKLQVNAIQK